MRGLKMSVRSLVSQILRLIQKLRQRSLVVSTGEARMPGAFVIGAPRSGTTLLRYVLDSHPAIAAPPETFLFEPLTECLRNDHTLEAMWHLGFHRDAVGKALGWSASQLLESYASSKGKQLWVEKTPANLFVLSEIETCLPESKFIMLYRNPLDVINSQYASGWVEKAVTIRNRRDPGDDDFLACCKFTAECYTRMGAFTRQTGSPIYAIRFEDIVEEPRRCFRELCDFLEVIFDDRILAFDQYAHDAGFGDVNIRQTRGIEDRSKRYQNWNPEQLERALAALAPARQYIPYDLT
jgi:protein-tyrosine sulfotransferase